MSAEVNDVNQHTLINIHFPSISVIEVIFKIKLPNREIISLKGMIDKGSTKYHLDISYVPKECRRALAMRQSASTMTFAQLHFDEGLRDVHIFFLSSDDKEEWYPLPQTWLSLVNHRYEFLIGLNFICANFGELIMTFDYISFFKHVTTTPTEFLISKNFTSKLSLSVVEPIIFQIFLHLLLKISLMKPSILSTKLITLIILAFLIY